MAATAPKIAGDDTIVWGCPESGITPSLGYLQSVTGTKTSEEEVVIDELGNTVSFIQFDPKGDLTLEFIIKGTITEPEIGDAVSALGKTGVVTSVDTNRANKAPEKRTIKAKFFDAITVTVGN